MSEDTQKHYFFQFPLCLLQPYLNGFIDREELKQKIVSWSLIHDGLTYWETAKDFEGQPQTEEEKRQHARWVWESSSHDVQKADMENHRHRAALLLMGRRLHRNHTPGLSVPDLDGVERRYEQVKRICERYLGDVGDGRKDTFVRLRDDLVWDGIGPGDIVLPDRRLRVLAGIYGAIGRAAYRFIPYERIRYLSAGFKSEAAYEAVREKRGPEAVPDLLTYEQVRYTVGKLVRTKWIAKYTKAGRSFYSKSIDVGEIAAKVEQTEQERLKRKIEAEKARMEQKQKTDRLREQLRQLQAVNGTEDD